MPDRPDTMPEPAPEGTRAALIAAGLKLFGRQGFVGTSTREIAAGAGTNVASIAYHFGGKEGLRSACGEEVARRIRAVAGSPAPVPPGLPPEAAARGLEAMLRAMVFFLATAPEAEDAIPFILREIAEDGPVLARLYAEFFEPKHRELCALWAAATGQEAESETTRLAVFAMLGQVLYFRIGRPVVLRRMGWERIGPEAAKRLSDLLAANLRALLAEGRRA